MTTYHDLLRQQNWNEDLSKLTAGDEIYQEIGGVNSQDFIKNTVTRVTKTLIVVGGIRYRIKDSREVGGYNNNAIFVVNSASTQFVENFKQRKKDRDAKRKKVREEQDAARKQEQEIISKAVEAVYNFKTPNEDLIIENMCHHNIVKVQYVVDGYTRTERIADFPDPKFLTQWLEMRNILRNNKQEIKYV